MECLSLFLFLFLSSFASPTIARNQSVVSLASEDQNQTSQLHTYIVHVHRKSAATSFSTDDEREEWYKSFLPASTASGGGPSRLVYSYNCVVTGFAARLTPDELAEVKRNPGFVHACADTQLSLATTHSPGFLGLHRHTAGLWNDSGYGRGVIIGVMDTGISPGHPSFSSDGGALPPPPARWKGACEFNASDCNNKLIGARSFLRGSNAMRGPPAFGAPAQGPYDYDGHGTHAAGTAAGMFVDGASVEGQAYGTASGIAPYAHLAIYKVCRDSMCASSDLLAGIDAAVRDGVDVLSISFQPFRLPGLFFSHEAHLPFHSDPIAIGTFRAVEKGIFVSAAAGNDGPSLSSAENVAPWILTAGAGSIDRSVRTTVRLGSGDEFDGESIYQPSNCTSPSLPLVHLGGTAASAYCLNGSFDSSDVEGRIVFCDDPGYSATAETGLVVKAAGGAGMIIASTRRDRYVPIPDVAHALPASHVSYSDGMTIKEYIRTTGGAATASICCKGTVLGTSPAPVVADFSSRGPSRGDPNILKPDIVGPGVNILAAWPWPSQAGDPSPASFNIISGTSVATAHLSGVAALLKNLHPDWSAAAIKSAIMTTADVTANDGNPITDQTTQPTNFFTLGSGHVNVPKASNPGLIYDIAPGDYVRYLCGLGYTSDQLAAVAGRSVDCSEVPAVAGSELNYPSFAVALNADNGYTAVVGRTVTNVGAPGSAYAVRVRSPLGASVTVCPERLYFSQANEKARFSVTFTGIVGIRGVASYSEGHLTWVSADNTTVVNSPMMVSVG